jgi:hypothetical protein
MPKSTRAETGSNCEQPYLPLPGVANSSKGRQTDFDFLRPLKPTVVFETYWRFAVERQNIYFRRLRNQPAPWTSDSILREHKFTNAYRASDRASQYLIQNVIYKGDQTASEIVFRTLVFKIFNRIGTWELLQKGVGEICLSNFSTLQYDGVLSKALDQGARIYSAAYIMPSGGRNSGYKRKHQMHLQLIARMMKDGLPAQIASAPSMSAAFHLLKHYPTIGDFLAYQYVTDINYSTITNYSETEFVVAGPGAKDGVRKCFSDLGGLTEDETIRFICERQDQCFDAIGVRFPSLWGRPLQLIDCQSLFCEVDKYARIAHPEFSGITGRTRIKQKLRPNKNLLNPWYPPKWGLNKHIGKESFKCFT